MHEASKSIFFRLKDSRYATRYLRGDGIDIGSGGDSLGQYYEFFPLMTSLRSWDLEDGDAQYMNSVLENTFDFVHSSHCLEHMMDPKIALNNWIRILKPGGHLICIIPDEDLYEQGIFPSTYNNDHKWTFTINKKSSWSPNSINLLDLIKNLDHDVEVKKIELMDSTYRYNLGIRVDQTTTPVGESAIEFILRKKS